MGFLNSETHSQSVLHLLLVVSLLLLCLLLAEQVLCSAAHIQVSWELISPVHRHPSPERPSLSRMTPQLQLCLTLGLLRSSLQGNLGTLSITLVLIKHTILIPLIILKNFDSFNWVKHAFIPLKYFFNHMAIHIPSIPSRHGKSQISYAACLRWGLNVSLQWGNKCKDERVNAVLLYLMQKLTWLFQGMFQPCKLIWKGKLSCRLRELSAHCSNDLPLPLNWTLSEKQKHP